jgi:hypothetical protein
MMIVNSLPTTTLITSCHDDETISNKYCMNASSHDSNPSSEEIEEEETPFQQLMNRGNCLRQLRLLALADELERQQPTNTTTTITTTNTSSSMVDSGFYQEEKKEEEEEEEEHVIISNNSRRYEQSSHPQDKELLLLSLQQEDRIRTLACTSTNKTVTMLDYNSYLVHQRYYDDLKHVDINYIDYGYIVQRNNCGCGGASSSSIAAVGNSGSAAGSGGGGRLVVEQRKSLGKGGLCWDAAFILGEHVIHQEVEWNTGVDTTTMTTTAGATAAGGGGAAAGRASRVVELGAGTGLCGMMVAKAVQCHVEITDLPELYDLMSANVERNFCPSSCIDPIANTTTTTPTNLANNVDIDQTSMGTISSRVLRWGIESDYQGAPYDCIIGADIVTNLYDPVALAQTIHALSGPNTRIYISGKARLDKPHEEFDVEMLRLFQSVKKIRMNDGIHSRLKSPNVFIIVAGGRRSL